LYHSVILSSLPPPSYSTCKYQNKKVAIDFDYDALSNNSSTKFGSSPSYFNADTNYNNTFSIFSSENSLKAFTACFLISIILAFGLFIFLNISFALEN